MSFRDHFTIADAKRYEDIEDKKSANLFLEEIKANEDLMEYVKNDGGFEKFAKNILKPYLKITELFTEDDAKRYLNIEDMESANLFLQHVEDNDEAVDRIEDDYPSFRAYAASIRKPYEDYDDEENYSTCSSEESSEFESVDSDDESVESFEKEEEYKNMRRDMRIKRNQITVLEEECRQIGLDLIAYRKKAKGIESKKQKTRTHVKERVEKRKAIEEEKEEEKDISRKKHKNYTIID